MPLSVAPLFSLHNSILLPFISLLLSLFLASCASFPLFPYLPFSSFPLLISSLLFFFLLLLNSSLPFSSFFFFYLTRCQQVARTAIASLPGAGIFGVELFELPDGRVLLNEVAPRPHNSGHYTIEACETSQFEAHLRAVLDMPLGSPALRVGCSLMLNVLGCGDVAGTRALTERAAAIPGATLHWYGKAEDKRGRKMAHVTLVAADLPTLRVRVAQLAEERANATVAHAAAGPVGIIMGSDSDLPTMRAAAEILEELEVRSGECRCERTAV